MNRSLEIIASSVNRVVVEMCRELVWVLDGDSMTKFEIISIKDGEIKIEIKDDTKLESFEVMAFKALKGVIVKDLIEYSYRSDHDRKHYCTRELKEILNHSINIQVDY